MVPFLAGFAFLVASKFTRWFMKERQVDKFDIRDNHDSTKNIFSEQYQLCKFCQIIRNNETLPEMKRNYSDDLISVFEDARPAAKYHLLVCPKEHIKSINTLDYKSKKDFDLLSYMKTKSIEIMRDKALKTNQPFDESNLKIGFHRVLSTSIDHLHMHVFALPFNNPSTAYRKYNGYFFAHFEEVISKFDVPQEIP